MYKNDSLTCFILCVCVCICYFFVQFPFRISFQSFFIFLLAWLFLLLKWRRKVRVIIVLWISNKMRWTRTDRTKYFGRLFSMNSLGAYHIWIWIHYLNLVRVFAAECSAFVSFWDRRMTVVNNERYSMNHCHCLGFQFFQWQFIDSIESKQFKDGRM